MMGRIIILEQTTLDTTGDTLGGTWGSRA